MNRDNLLKSIAETGYNVGFGAKKHFATYDIVDKVPGLIGFLGISAGIIGLVFEVLSSKIPSAALAILGVAALYISFYDHKKEDYAKAGVALTLLFNELRDLYRSVQDGADLAGSSLALKDIESRFHANSISKQILLSDWYAHYKFFLQMQIDWVDEQKKFRITDKIPFSGAFWLIVITLSAAILFFARCYISR